MKILCVYPALLSGWSSYNCHGNNESSYMNHGFAMISAVLKGAGHEPFLVDLRAQRSWEHFEEVLRTVQYDCSLISFLSCDEDFAKKATEIMKMVAPDKHIIGGGIHLSVTQATEFPNIDTIVLGEGENHILDIVKCIEAGEKPKKLYELSPIQDLDSLPFVDRSFFNPQMEETSPLLPLLPEPFVTIVAGRGCFGKCTFCAPSRERISGRKIHVRSAKNFVDEIVMLNSRPGGIGSLMIHDDLFGSKIWMKEFIGEWTERLPRIPFWCQMRADTIIAIKDFIPSLAKMGLTWVSLGLESGSQRMLDFLEKGVTVEQNIEACDILHESHVNIFGNYIIGLPTETQEDLDATERMLERTRPEWHSTCVYTSYPGSKLYEWVKENDYWVEGKYSSLPHAKKIKGVDYSQVERLCSEWPGKYKGELRIYKPEVNSVIIKNRVDESKPKISIILVSYCRPDYLREAVQSIFDQTLSNWQLIINDYSPLDNLDISEVLSWAEEDQRVTVLRHKENVDNIAYCWNEALDLVTGEYWATLDDDNKKHPTFCEKMSRYLDSNPGVDMAVCGMRHIGSQDGIHLPVPSDLPHVRRSNRIDSGEIVYRRSVVDQVGYFDDNMTCLDDWDYILRFLSIIGDSHVGFLGEVLTDYRWHESKRIHRSKGLDYDRLFAIARDKRTKATLSVKLLKPDFSSVTESQKQVILGIEEGLSCIPFVTVVEDNPDLVVATGPSWCYSIEGLKANHVAPMMLLCMEDPQGLQGNLDKIDFFDWIVTNDFAAFEHYKKVFKNPSQVYLWNCLSITQGVEELCKTQAEKEFDVCIIGHPYDARAKFVKELRSKLHKTVSMVVVGDGWKEKGISNVTTYPTLDPVETAKIGMKSRIVVCKHREDGDCGKYPILPQSINRGYIESAYHCSVLIDSDREDNSLPSGFVRYTNYEDCSSTIKILLDDKENLDILSDALYSVSKQFTYRERLMKILNGYRSPRHNMMIS